MSEFEAQNLELYYDAKDLHCHMKEVRGSAHKDSRSGGIPDQNRLFEEYEDLKQIKNRIELENESEKAIEKTIEKETKTERRGDEDEDSECSSRLREFLMRGLGTIEEEDEEKEDSRMREIGEEYEHPGHFRKEEGKGEASGEGDHIHRVKLMSFEEFCAENFAVSLTFVEDMMEESRISQRRLEQAHEELGDGRQFGERAERQ
ncbi:unnamed protein product [Rodentolepis nana]|uniref:Uncharacterized protein n=1 Tax=Rodentolepis nana TaxID=102285 RepID=A0A0R3TTZ8_RODNA|nr:unnamed protein product [Rodentolepis nana]